MENGDLSRKIYIPQIIDNDNEYYGALKKSFRAYVRYISNDTFDLSTEEKIKVRGICDKILNSLNLYYEGRIQKATSQISEILKELIESKFIVSDLDDNYAFRTVGRCGELHDKNHDYSHLDKPDLTFFRARVSDAPLDEWYELSHIPANKRELTSTERFCIAGIPCLYLGVSTYTCWNELDFPSNSKFYCSAVQFNEEGKKLKILNLAVPFKLILEERKNILWHDLIKLYPLVLATSYHIKQKDRKFKSEYIISQLIMHCLKKLKIDGVGYMSTKLKGEMNFPLNVCLALPVFDEKTFDKTFKLTQPMQLEKFTNIQQKDKCPRTFINGYYACKEMFVVDVSDVSFFKKSVYSIFDDYLANQYYKCIELRNEELKI